MVQNESILDVEKSVSTKVQVKPKKMVNLAEGQNPHILEGDFEVVKDEIYRGFEIKEAVIKHPEHNPDGNEYQMPKGKMFEFGQVEYDLGKLRAVID